MAKIGLLLTYLTGATALALHASVSCDHCLRRTPMATRATVLHAKLPSTPEGYTPLGNQILVDLQSLPSETKAGILLPTVYADDAPAEFVGDDVFRTPEVQAGVVIAMGPGLVAEDGSRVPMPPIAVGQKVIVAADPNAGEKCLLDGVAARDNTLFLYTPENIWAAC